MKGKAAISYGEGEFSIEEVNFTEISEEELLIKIHSVGICHTDIASTKSIYPFTYPVILGHEGAGEVVKKGKNVDQLDVGDHVILTYAHCMECDHCQSNMPYICESFYSLNTEGITYEKKKKITLENGKKVSNFFGQSSFSEYAIVHKSNVIKVSKELPLKYLGPLACGIMTGFGAVTEKLQPKEGDSIGIFGCGTVGISSIIASKLAGAYPIVAIDINDSKLELAKKMGATHVINSHKVNLQVEIKKILPKGLYYAIESTGIPSVLSEIMDTLAIPGEVVVLTATKYGMKIELDYKQIQSERKLSGTIMGSVNPVHYIPKLLNLFRDGKLPLKEMITFYPFNNINEAIRDIEQGRTLKAVLILNER